MKSFTECVDEYKAVSNALRLTPEKKLQFIPIILKGDARRFYKDMLRKHATSYENTMNLITAKFNIPEKQRIKKFLNSLRLQKFVTKDGAPQDAFTELVAKVERLFPQVPPSFMCEDNKLELLEQDILGMQWESAAIAKMHKNGASFVSFMTDLAKGLQIGWTNRKLWTHPKIKTYFPTITPHLPKFFGKHVLPISLSTIRILPNNTEALPRGHAHFFAKPAWSASIVESKGIRPPNVAISHAARTPSG